MSTSPDEGVRQRQVVDLSGCRCLARTCSAGELANVEVVGCGSRMSVLAGCGCTTFFSGSLCKSHDELVDLFPLVKMPSVSVPGSCQPLNGNVEVLFVQR